LDNYFKKVLIAGYAGQDGYYLSKLLSKKGYSVYGVDRTVCPESLENMSGTAQIELSNAEQFVEYVKEIMPDEIYYLAAHHFSSQGDQNRCGKMSPFLSVNLITPNAILEFIKDNLPTCRFFYAASAHIFGIPESSPQNETTPHNPDTPYAISKSSAVQLCRYYRRTHGIFAVSGILYNHESPRRDSSFVTTQIANAAASAALGVKKTLILRDLAAIVDWGAAEDYVNAMWLTLQQNDPDEYIISSGIARTVMEFATEAFSVFGLKADEHIIQEPNMALTNRIPYVGDNSKIKELCGWEPAVEFKVLVNQMVDAQLISIRSNQRIA